MAEEGEEEEAAEGCRTLAATSSKANAGHEEMKEKDSDGDTGRAQILIAGGGERESADRMRALKKGGGRGGALIAMAMAGAVKKQGMCALGFWGVTKL